MLQQMLAEDKADMVREAVIKSLGIIMGYIDDPDKYSQVCLSGQKSIALPCANYNQLKCLPIQCFRHNVNQPHWLTLLFLPTPHA